MERQPQNSARPRYGAGAPDHPAHAPQPTGPRTEACRLPQRKSLPGLDRPDLSDLTLFQQHQVRRPDPRRDQQQRDHQRGW